MTDIIPLPSDYGPWLAELKTRIHQAQQRASRSVNRELVLLYWQIGRDILERQGREGLGAKVIERFSVDLRNAFPEMKGFSRANLLYMRAFAEAWPDPQIVQQAVGQLLWGHNLVLLSKLTCGWPMPPGRRRWAGRAPCSCTTLNDGCWSGKGKPPPTSTSACLLPAPISLAKSSRITISSIFLALVMKPVSAPSRRL